MDARSYSIGAQRGCLEWVAWMLAVTTEALRVTSGPVIWVAAGVTRDRNYQPACEGLMWEWYKRTGHSGVFLDGIELAGEAGSMYRPCYWHRVGIPGSGGDQWFRADMEYAMCFRRPGKLEWSDNTACGHKPKLRSGGAPSHRTKDGLRAGLQRAADEGKPLVRMTRRKIGAGLRDKNEFYVPPDIANPGNLISTGAAGGGRLGSLLAHENEAPYPEKLAEFFVASLCPLDGITFDPFSGSGTTAAAALNLGRRFVASDLRQNQCQLTRRRVGTVTPGLNFG